VKKSCFPEFCHPEVLNRVLTLSWVQVDMLRQRFLNWAPRRPGAPRDFVRGAAKASESCCICRGSPRTGCLVSSPFCASNIYNGKILSGRVACTQIT